ncbi:hypothetical protein FQN52_003920 [Onygenales sp. PD_12]|nr:hypothetical protein FQN52_003920 [Onygenales sp. PD_12]
MPTYNKHDTVIYKDSSTSLQSTGIIKNVKDMGEETPKYEIINEETGRRITVDETQILGPA